GWFRRFQKPIFAILVILSLCLVGTGTQKKKKRSRRTSKAAAATPGITNPDIAPPTDGDVKIISTADQNGTEADQLSDQTQPKKSKTPSTSSDQKEDMQQTITTLSNQVTKLNDKLTQ